MCGLIISSKLRLERWESVELAALLADETVWDRLGQVGGVLLALVIGVVVLALAVVVFVVGLWVLAVVVAFTPLIDFVWWLASGQTLIWHWLSADFDPLFGPIVYAFMLLFSAAALTSR